MFFLDVTTNCHCQITFVNLPEKILISLDLHDSNYPILMLDGSR